HRETRSVLASQPTFLKPPGKVSGTEHYGTPNAEPVSNHAGVNTQMTHDTLDQPSFTCCSPRLKRDFMFLRTSSTL
ncbi:hypothetical protein, partial [Deinococcus soli (ex Cha et al. 2016)]|uniref:hypothetical protein n=1 Tax=Deinococcus soli (ex Cha et al. 2016) TaxID=1309411 RepID=UPI001E33B03E